ncbi:magnesium ion transporter [Exophiala xenobiotica]|uniref:Magnesium transporter n=1 Tax=Lithohypha guttulata TaxID=1690604 RepID=A0ABR0K1Y4_9EURO|nr:magnesium ion transporter [Lithohypha guttulata]KAK5312415.1 magnesium ion transporter [Exophiala xenobiotica]
MSVLSGTPTPSTALLRFLRTQSETVCFLRADEVASRTCRNTVKPSRRRQISSSSRQCYGSPRSYIDDVFSRNRDKCKALPAPRAHPSQNHIYASRHASSDTSPPRYERPSLWQRIFHRGRIRNEQKQYEQQTKSLPDYSLSNGGSYEETSAQLFNLSRALSRNTAGTELKLRCTEFDSNGRVTLVSGEFKKSELIAKYGLLPRDLRKIDSSVLPHILSDRVLVFDAYGSTDSYTQSLFMYDLEGKLRQKTSNSTNPDPSNPDKQNYLPYEFRALEAVLISVTSGLEAEFALVREPVTHILRALEEDIDREKLRHLLIHSKKLGTFEQKARLVRDAMEELLEADDDLASMYLTERKKTGKRRDENEHTEIEMLLESYHKICDEVVEISGNLISNIRNTEEVVKAILDANRNQLMLFEIKVSIATLGLAGGTLVAGFYGMNLENFIEETNWGFSAVTGFSIAFSAWLCVYGLRKLRKVQKVRMWGESGMEPGPYSSGSVRSATARLEALGAMGMGAKGNWRTEALEALAMGEERKRKLESRYGTSAGRPLSGAGTGPVLWPGMEGLGLHKLNLNAKTNAAGEVEDTNSDADTLELNSSPRREGSSSSSSTVRIKDDTAIGLSERKK